MTANDALRNREPFAHIIRNYSRLPEPVARLLPLAIAMLMVLGVSGCITSIHPGLEWAEFREHVATKQKDRVRISVAVLTDAEARRYFGCDFQKDGIQAVWLDVRNENDYWLALIPRTMDPEYYSPLEVAFIYHRTFSAARNRELDRRFLRSAFPTWIGPRSTGTGFVFTSRTEGAKFVNVELWHDKGLTHAGFFMELPDKRFDFQAADFAEIYPPAKIKPVNLPQLHKVLVRMPCCTTNIAGNRNGDPVNFVLVGKEDAVMGALTRQGWDPTHTIDSESVRRTITSFLFSGRYRYSPVSRLFYFNRGQDLAMQKARRTVSQRNHLRLWRAPYKYGEQDVWMGQISRDIGVRFTTASPAFVTHKIDPAVDEARNYLVQDMFTSGFLDGVAFVHGIGVASQEAPHRNLTGDPYFTDGLRAVMFISSQPVPSDKMKLIQWSEPLPTE